MAYWAVCPKAHYEIPFPRNVIISLQFRGNGKKVIFLKEEEGFWATNRAGHYPMDGFVILELGLVLIRYFFRFVFL